jgi:hypothetical protein
LLAVQLWHCLVCRAAQAHKGLRPDSAVRNKSLGELKLFDLTHHGFIEYLILGGFRRFAM